MGAIFMPTNNNEIQKHQPQIKVSIDRLTVVGDFPTDLFMDHYYKWQREHDFVRESGQGLQVVDTTQYVNTGEDVPQEQVAYMEIPKFQKDKLRLDFNPNHGLQTPGGQWLLELKISITVGGILLSIFLTNHVQSYIGFGNLALAKVFLWDANEKCKRFTMGRLKVVSKFVSITNWLNKRLKARN